MFQKKLFFIALLFVVNIFAKSEVGPVKEQMGIYIKKRNVCDLVLLSIVHERAKNTKEKSIAEFCTQMAVTKHVKNGNLNEETHFIQCDDAVDCAKEMESLFAQMSIMITMKMEQSKEELFDFVPESFIKELYAQAEKEGRKDVLAFLEKHFDFVKNN